MTLRDIYNRYIHFDEILSRPVKPEDSFDWVMISEMWAVIKAHQLAANDTSPVVHQPIGDNPFTIAHPMQPLYTDSHGVIRFKRNAIVEFLLNAYPPRLNGLAVMSFEDEDREQLAQLIGYSVGGFAELSYVCEATLAKLDIMCSEKDAIILSEKST